METCKDYKKSKTVEERKRLSEELLVQHPDKAPIIFTPDETLLKFNKDSSKFKVVKILAQRSHNMAKLQQILQSKLEMAPDETLFIFLNKKSLQPGSIS